MSLRILEEYERLMRMAMTKDGASGASMSATPSGFMGGLNTVASSCFICGKEATRAFAINGIVYLCNDHKEISPDILRTLVGDNVTT